MQWVMARANCDGFCVVGKGGCDALLDAVVLHERRRKNGGEKTGLRYEEVMGGQGQEER